MLYINHTKEETALVQKALTGLLLFAKMQIAEVICTI